MGVPRRIFVLVVCLGCAAGELIADRKASPWQEALAHADQCRAAGKYSEARQSYLQAVAEAKKFGDDDARLGETLNNFGAFLFDFGDYPLAETMFRRALDILDRDNNPEDSETANVLSNMAAILARDGRLDEGRRTMERVLSILAKKTADAPALASTLNNLADVARRQGREKDAEDLYRRSIAAWQSNVQAALPMGNLAALHFLSGRLEEAEKLLDACVRMQSAALGPDHPRMANNLAHLGELYTLQGRYAEAEELLRRALAIKEKSAARDHPDMIMILSALGRLMTTTGRLDEAGPLFDRALEIARKSLPAGNAELGAMLVNIGRYRRQRGDWADSRNLLEEALSILERSLGPDHLRTIAALTALGELFAVEGRLEAADAMYRRAMAALDRAGATPRDRLAVLISLARICRARGHFTEAAQLYRMALPICKDSLPPEAYAAKLRELAAIYRAGGRSHDAGEVEKSARQVTISGLLPAQ